MKRFTALIILFCCLFGSSSRAQFYDSHVRVKGNLSVASGVSDQKANDSTAVEIGALNGKQGLCMVPTDTTHAYRKRGMIVYQYHRGLDSGMYYFNGAKWVPMHASVIRRSQCSEPYVYQYNDRSVEVCKFGLIFYTDADRSGEHKV